MNVLPVVKHNKHRKYRLLSQHDTYCTVLDIVENTSYTCFVLDHKIGDEFYLFEREMNVFTGKKTFSYSILNLYTVGESYQFNIINESEKFLIISNYEKLNFAIPISFSNGNIDHIDLEVLTLDLDYNKLKFNNKTHKSEDKASDEPVDFDCFDKDKTYNLIVENTFINKNNRLIAVCSYNEKQYFVYIPDALCDSDLSAGIEVFLGKYKDGTPCLKCTRKFIVEKIYQVGNRYAFELEKECVDPENGLIYWITKDSYGMINHYYPANDFSFDSVGNRLEGSITQDFYVSGISQGGFLRLAYGKNHYRGVNYLVEEVFESLGFENREDELFFDLFSNRKKSQDIENTQESLSYIDQYNEGENLWVFSYMSFLDQEIFMLLEEENYHQTKELILLYERLERWVLEGSDYLKNFSTYKVQDIIQKAESKIKNLKALITAIDLYLEDKDYEFLSSLKNQLSRSPYLSEEKLDVIKQFTRITEYFTSDYDNTLLYEIILLLVKKDHVVGSEKWQFINVIERNIHHLRGKVVEFLNSNNSLDVDKEALKCLIINQYLLAVLYIDYENSLKASITAVNLLRYLSYLFKDVAYLNLSVELLVKQGQFSNNLINLVDIFNLAELNIEGFQNSVDFSKATSLQYKGQGFISMDSQGFNLISKNTFNDEALGFKKQLASIFNGSISVDSCIVLPGIKEQDSVPEIFKKLFEAIRYTKPSSGKPKTYALEEVEFSFDTEKIYVGKVKKIREPNEKYIYLKCDVEGVTMDTLYHFVAFQKVVIFKDINEIFSKGDTVLFQIKEFKKGRITVSSKRIIERYADTLIEKEILTSVIVLQKSNQVAYGISLEGLPVRLEGFIGNVNDVVDVKVIDYNSYDRVFLVEDVKQSSCSFDGNPIDLYRKFLINAGVLQEKSNQEILDNGVNSKLVGNDHLVLGRLKLLVHILEQYLSYLSEKREIILFYYVLSVICGIIKNGKSYYYTDKLNSLARITALQSDSDIELLETPQYDSKLYYSEKNLQQEDIGLTLLSYYDKNVLEIPMVMSSESKFFKLKKIIEASNLLSNYNVDDSMRVFFKRMILNELSDVSFSDHQLVDSFDFSFLDEEDQREHKSKDFNLGLESKIQEFKSSLFYSASKESQSDVILRTISGFLNSYDNGGSLFLGIADNGEVKGLADDLNFNPNIKTLDNYQNHIQSLVVKYLSKEINALLDYKFHKYRGLDYLEIIVPRFDRPIAFKDEFYQRQGVQTRILKGQDLTDFIIRKSTGGFMYDQSKRENDLDNNLETYDIKSKRDVNKEDILVDDIPYDKEMECSLSDNYVKKDVLVYFYIFANNDYMVSKNILSDFLFCIPITDSYRFGYLLFCYDNACVNKVEIRSVLAKTLDKRYMNAMSDYGRLMVVLPSFEKGEIAIETSTNDRSYLKVLDINKISTHKIVGLKGNCIVQADIDKVNKYRYLENKQDDDLELDSFRRESRQGQGYILKPGDLKGLGWK